MIGALALFGPAVAAEPIEVRIALDAEPGWLRIEESLFLPEGAVELRGPGARGPVVSADLELSGEDRSVVAVASGRWRTDGQAGRVEVSYRVRPGGDGRHGRQGWVATDWASFDGRVLVMPVGVSVTEVRFDVDIPQGWSVVHPWSEAEGTIVANGPGLAAMLPTSCMAFGAFGIDEQQHGETLVRVGTPVAWDPQWRAELNSGTHQMFAWFQAELGYDPGIPFAVAWLPSPEGALVFGGAGANGTCFQHPDPSARAWQLLGHRIAHPLNRYRPTGMEIQDSKDLWFVEGWASYAEVRSTAGSGVAPDESYWNLLYRRYARVVRRDPASDHPLDVERAHPEAAEYLHYTKGPLVSALLADRVRRRSGVSLEDFMAHLVGKYGGHQAPVPLRRELQAFTGHSYDDFWSTFVDRQGALYPVWPGAVDDRVEARMERPVVATAGGLAVREGWLTWLAASGRFKSLSSLIRYVEQALDAQRRLENRTESLLPEVLRPFQSGLSGRAQFGIAETSIHAAALWDHGETEPASLSWPDTPVRRQVQALLELERTAAGAVDITPAALLVEPGRALAVELRWKPGVPPVSIGVGSLSVPPLHWTPVSADAEWTGMSIVLPAEDRDPSAVLLISVQDAAGGTSTHPVWQAHVR